MDKYEELEKRIIELEMKMKSETVVYIFIKILNSLSHYQVQRRLIKCEQQSILQIIYIKNRKYINPPNTDSKNRISRKFGYFMQELSLIQFMERNYSWNYDHNEATTKKAEINHDSVRAIFALPLTLEKPMWFGFLLTLCIWLSYVIYLPLRICYIILNVVKYLITFGYYSLNLHRTHLFDCLRFLIFLISLYCLFFISFTKLYHLIRGQELMKFYVIYNMLDIANTLLASLCHV